MIRKISAGSNIFYVLFFLFVTLFIGTISLVDKIAPLTLSHAVYYCQKTLSHFVIELPHSFPSIITLALTMIVLIGITIFIYRILKMNCIISELLRNKIPTPLVINKLLRDLNLSNKIVVVNNEKNIAFCYGLFWPKIYISKQLIQVLTKKELRAVLTHEKYHLQKRDPMKILFSQVAVSMFFFMPILKDLQNFFSMSKELEADQATIKDNGIKSLQNALIKLINNSVQPYTIAAPFVQKDTLELRVQNLTSTKIQVIHLSITRLISSILVGILFIFLLNLPVHAMENENNTHSYFICPFGDQCMMSCEQEGMSNDILFSQSPNFSQVKNSSGPNP